MSYEFKLNDRYDISRHVVGMNVYKKLTLNFYDVIKFKCINYFLSQIIFWIKNKDKGNIRFFLNIIYFTIQKIKNLFSIK